MTTPEQPQLRFIMTLRVDVGNPQELGTCLGNARRIIPILGGSFIGPALSGEVLPGGADYQFTRPDGVAQLEARYTLRTLTGDLISVVNHGLRHGRPGVLERLLAGERVPRAEYYFMSSPRFEAAAESLQWLTRHLFLADAEREANRVILNIWQAG